MLPPTLSGSKAPVDGTGRSTVKFSQLHSDFGTHDYHFDRMTRALDEQMLLLSRQQDPENQHISTCPCEATVSVVL